MQTRRRRTVPLYSADLAHIHDAGFANFAEQAAPEVIRILREHGIRDGLIVEAGCGSGVLARRLVDAGYEVFGFDQSRSMIRLARARAPGAHFRVASLARQPVPACRAVLAIGEIVTYVPRGLGSFFRRAQAAVADGGLFIFDFIESAEQRTYPAKTIAGDGWSMVARADLNKTGRILTRRLTTSRQIGGRRRQSREIHRVHIYPRSEIAELLERAGFTVRMMRSYGRYRMLPGDVVVIARKPSRRRHKAK